MKALWPGLLGRRGPSGRRVLQREFERVFEAAASRLVETLRPHRPTVLAAVLKLIPVALFAQVIQRILDGQIQRSISRSVSNVA